MIQPEIEKHLRNDAFAQWLGATIETIEPGYSRVSLVVSESMLNFHRMTHGGLVFALGDIAFGAASNSHGQTALALNVAINFVRATGVGDHLVAEAKEVQQGGTIALYDIVVSERNSGQLVAKSQATVYRKRQSFV
ncbi:thioesterase superfamily protein [Desulfobulbus propionicus DSM 2032]|jgi:acyl-CoA thioesterase|uniref:Thioesterase superfamily protein n=1 Tax=Desulfobulbus propionicus (strain ATCC 33891 / DSM 2032 / VKM B-1956 / 1pr3) TaxID=577650 RepID=A0A7U3YN97_DESPD|nr:hotdog fold thioesterase [Desulfobulbus propionicus]ADW18512.1 thioesterase superfamily protein [Desulfobulbus propionicus DSM 2032]